MNITEPQPISYDTNPNYDNDWNGINGGANKGGANRGGFNRKIKKERKSSPILSKVGGEAIASGGYGCVFKPALLCKNQTHRPPGKISKLMIQKYAEREYNEIQQFQRILSSIPNYTHYFLLNDFTLCEPAPLSPTDLANFKKCRALPKDHITEKNINQSLSKIRALTMPDGGIAVDDFIQQSTRYSSLLQLNHSLIQLLQKGIIPMNRKHIYHSDIKDSNVLVQTTNTNTNKKEFYTRLIDWGISVEYNPHKNNDFPSLWKNRPLQINTPFSCILFTDLFVEKFSVFLSQNHSLSSLEPNERKEKIAAFVIDYLYLWIQKRGPGHYKAINHMMYILFSEDLKNMTEKTKEDMIEMNYTLVYIKNYLTEIIDHYTQKGIFNVPEYLNNVYVKIIDVWGFVSIYFPLLENLFEYRDQLTSIEKELFENLKQIVLKYLYNPRIHPISIAELSKDLKGLNHFFNEKIRKDNETTRFMITKTHAINKTTASKKKRFQTLNFLSKRKETKSTKNVKIQQGGKKRTRKNYSII